MALNQVGLERLNTATTKKIGTNKNLIINGSMQVAQRGTPTASGSYTTAAYGSCDRWKLEANSTDQAAFVISQESDAPTGSGFSNSIKIKTNTAETTLDSNEILHLSQPIEAQDLQHLKNGTSSALSITLSFWVKSYQTGTFVVTVYKPDNTQRIISATYTISASNTWEFKTMTFSGDTSGSGIANDTGTGFQIYWILAAGSTFTGTTNTSWANYSNGGFANGQAVNIMSSTDNYYYLTGVQLEVGSVATDFEHRKFAQELTLCQRYYTRLTGGGGNQLHFTGSTKQQQYVSCSRVELPTTMRAAPSISFTGTRDILNYSNDNSGFSGDVIDVDSFNVRWGSSATIGDGTAYTAALTGNPNFVECSSEL